MTRAGTRRTGGWLRVASLAACAVGWQIGASVVAEPLFPTPSVVLGSLWGHLVAGELLVHLGITLLRVTVSFVLAMAIGTAVGILMGRSHRVDAALDGLLVLTLNVPALVTAILCYVWLGLSETAAVTAVALNKIPTVIVTVREGARALDRSLLDVASAFQVPRWRTLRWVYLPQLYPYLVASARSGLALIWKIVLVVELLGRSNGIGFQLGTYFQFFDIVSILAYTLAFAVAVLVVEGLGLRPLERHLARWRA